VENNPLGVLAECWGFLCFEFLSVPAEVRLRGDSFLGLCVSFGRVVGQWTAEVLSFVRFHWEGRLH